MPPPWALLGLTSALFAALVAIFGKLGVDKVDPVAATMARALIMAAATSIAAVGTGAVSELGGVGGRAWTFIVLSGLAGAASWLAYFAALRSGQAGAVAGLDRLSVAFVVVIAALFLGESLSVAKVVGAALMVGGALLIAR